MLICCEYEAMSPIIYTTHVLLVCSWFFFWQSPTPYPCILQFSLDLYSPTATQAPLSGKESKILEKKNFCLQYRIFGIIMQLLKHARAELVQPVRNDNDVGKGPPNFPLINGFKAYVSRFLAKSLQIQSGASFCFLTF